MPFNIAQLVKVQVLALFVCYEAHSTRLDKPWVLTTSFELCPAFSLHVNAEQLVHSKTVFIDTTKAEELFADK